MTESSPRWALLVLAISLLMLPACRSITSASQPTQVVLGPPLPNPPLSARGQNVEEVNSASEEEINLSTSYPPIVQEALNELPVSDFRSRFDEEVSRFANDYHHYYQRDNLFLFGLGVAAAAPIANTQADQEFRDWYQGQVNSEHLDDLADVVNVAGQFWFVVPLSVELLALKGKFGEDYWKNDGFTEWGHRSLRAVAVGYPPVLVMYGLLGSRRPDRGPGSSYWKPFQDIRGVSGHTFMGAIPFLTAASMVEAPLLKGAFLIGSFATGWSRIHKDRHYISQVALGWWLAYLSVRSVKNSHEEQSNWQVMPTVIDGTPGVAVHLEY